MNASGACSPRHVPWASASSPDLLKEEERADLERVWQSD